MTQSLGLADVLGGLVVAFGGAQPPSDQLGELYEDLIAAVTAYTAGHQGNQGHQGFQGAQGAQGPQGNQGAQGAQGPPA